MCPKLTLKKLKQAKEETPHYVFVPRERKVPKFSGKLGTDGVSTSKAVEDFIQEVESVIAARKMVPKEQVDFITSHLEGPAKDELRYRSSVDRASAEAIYEILRGAFGEKRSVPQLFKQFYDRKQKDGETLRVFSHSLLELLDCVAQRCPEAVQNKDQVLRDHFADNVRDPMMRKELKKMIREQPASKFFQVREEAIRWSEEEEKPAVKGKSATSEVTTSVFETADVHGASAGQAASGDQNTLLADILKTMQEQQKVIKDLTSAVAGKNVQQGQGQKKPFNRKKKPLQYTDDGKPICYRCDQPGHIGRECPQKKSNSESSETSANTPLNSQPLSQ